MDYFDKIIKNTFKNEKKELPNEYSWDEMKSGIFEKMEEEKPSRKIIFWWFGGISAAILLIFLFLNSIKNDKNVDRNSFDLNNKNIVKKNESIKQNQKVLSKIDDNIVIESEEPTQEKLSKNELQKKNTKLNYNPNQSFTKNTNNNTGRTIELSEVGNSDTKISNNLISENPRAFELAGNVNEIYNFTLLRNIQLKPLNYYMLLPTMPLAQDNKLLITNNNKTSKNLSYAYCLNSGSNTFFGKHENGSNLDKYSKNLIGYYFGVETNFYKRNWYFTLGYRYQNIISVFKFKDKDQVKKDWVNIPLIINTNSITGNTTTMRGDATLLSERIREIVYYNNFKTHSIYIGIGQLVELNSNFDLEIAASSIYTFKIINDGINLDENNELIYFNNGKNSIYRNKQFAMGLKTILLYKLNNSWKIGLSLEANKYLSNWSSNSTINYKPTILDLGLLTKYSIK